MGMKVLLVEDEMNTAIVLEEYLSQSGFVPVWLSDGTKVVPWVKLHGPDIVLLDLMLPGRNGFDLCRDIREFSKVPIIMVSARSDENDRLLGLEVGADDYICKPFSLREVVARVKMILRRTGEHQAPSKDELILDVESFHAVLRGKELELTATEFFLLQVLYQDPGRIFSREQIMERVYADQRIVSYRTIDSHVKKLRKKMTVVAPDVELIHSVYSLGYKFEVPTSPP